MKTIKEYAQKNGLIAVPVQYFHAATGTRERRKGFDVCTPNGIVLFTLEPVSYRFNGSKWLIKSRSRLNYVKRITPKVLSAYDNAAPTGFVNLFAVYLHASTPELREATT